MSVLLAILGTIYAVGVLVTAAINILLWAADRGIDQRAAVEALRRVSRSFVWPLMLAAAIRADLDAEADR